MSKDVFILSTLSADQLYTAWRKGGADLPLVERQVFVRGGANVADKRLVTPQGVVTKVSAEDLELLESNAVFQLHKSNGYITVSRSKPSDPDAAAASQANRSPDAPLTDGDFAEGKAPTSSTAAPVAPTTDAGTGHAQRDVRNPRRA